jgi:enterochelin esterase family protein
MLVVAAVCLASVLPATFAVAQSGPPPILKSHEVNADRSVTFRYYGPGAKTVGLSLDINAKPVPMTKDDHGIWSVTTPVLPPEIYGYSFVVDNYTLLDPANTDARANYVYYGSQVLVPGTPPQPWELTDIPHGTLTHVTFTTHVAQHLPANQSAYMVYTPPGYDEHRKGGYPVLYLLHGWSDNENAWTRVGGAQYIMDTLIHEGKAKPMIVVMTLGYGDLNFVTSGWDVWQDPGKIIPNTNLFGQELLTEVMPAVEKDYNVAKGRENHAIIGLSMGGLESLVIGLNHTDTFAYVGGMSAAIHNTDPNKALPAFAAPDAATKANLKLLWVACGTEDGLITPNRKFVAWAKAKGLNPVAVETPGQHIWEVWRDNLVHFAPLLFQSH